MSDPLNGPTTSSAVIVVISVVLAVGLCGAGFAQWLFRHRGRSGSSAQGSTVLPISRFIQPQTIEVQTQPQPLPTEDDLDKWVPIMDFKTWKGQQSRARHCAHSNSIKPETQDNLATTSISKVSTSFPIAPAKYPVNLSPLKGGSDKIRMSVPDKPPSNRVHLESSQPPDDVGIHSIAAQQTTAQATSDDMFSNYVCAICLGIIGDEVEVRGLPCAHVFHVDCVNNWLLRCQPCCPVCKRPFRYSQ